MKQFKYVLLFTVALFIIATIFRSNQTIVNADPTPINTNGRCACIWTNPSGVIPSAPPILGFTGPCTGDMLPNGYANYPASYPGLTLQQWCHDLSLGINDLHGGNPPNQVSNNDQENESTYWYYNGIGFSWPAPYGSPFMCGVRSDPTNSLNGGAGQIILGGGWGTLPADCYNDPFNSTYPAATNYNYGPWATCPTGSRYDTNSGECLTSINTTGSCNDPLFQPFQVGPTLAEGEAPNLSTLLGTQSTNYYSAWIQQDPQTNNLVVFASNDDESYQESYINAFISGCYTDSTTSNQDCFSGAQAIYIAPSGQDLAHLETVLGMQPFPNGCGVTISSPTPTPTPSPTPTPAPCPTPGVPTYNVVAPGFAGQADTTFNSVPYNSTTTTMTGYISIANGCWDGLNPSECSSGNGAGNVDSVYGQVTSTDGLCQMTIQACGSIISTGTVTRDAACHNSGTLVLKSSVSPGFTCPRKFTFNPSESFTTSDNINYNLTGTYSGTMVFRPN